MDYITVKNYGTDFFTEKKSKFIGYCKPVKTEEEAKAFIAEIKANHKDANHNVWAYNLRDSGIMRYSDDGEPQGTAGIPMLEVMKKSGIIDAVIVVTRYFGGIMLGGGGLLRAYSHGASIAIKSANPVCMKLCTVASLKCDYTYYNKLQELFDKNNTMVDDTVFDESVTVFFHALPKDLVEFSTDFSNLTKGKGEITEISSEYNDFPIN